MLSKRGHRVDTAWSFPILVCTSLPTRQSNREQNPIPAPRPVTVCGAALGGKPALFNNDFYFAGQLPAIKGSNDQSNIGPLDYTCRGSIRYPESWQYEPFRYRPSDEALEFYDIHWLAGDVRQRLVDSSFAEEIGSSSPKFFTVANEVLYFQATANGTDKEIYRQTSSCGVPEVLPLNQNAPSEGKPIGEFLGRLWFTADSGAGQELHYLDNNGESGVPFTTDIAFSGPWNYDGPTGFVEFDNGVVFSAINTAGEMGTYFARIDREPIPIPVVEPCAPEPELSIEFSVNDVDHDSRPRLKVRRGSLLTLSCDAASVPANQSATLTVSIWERSAQRTGNRRLRLCNLNQNTTSTAQCTARVRAKHGRTRYWCRAKAKHESGRSLRKHAATIVLGTRPRARNRN